MYLRIWKPFTINTDSFSGPVCDTTILVCLFVAAMHIYSSVQHNYTYTYVHMCSVYNAPTI